MTTAQEKLDRHYEDLESTWCVVDRSEDYKYLVTSSGNAKTPFHRWFHLKEAFAHDLITRLRADEPKTDAGSGWRSVFDPFSGGGTTLLSSLSAGGVTDGSILLGIERNAALRLISDAKLIGYCLPREELPGLLSAARALEFSGDANACTESATLNNPRFFDPAHVSQILGVRDQLKHVKDERFKTILECVLLGTVESVGRVRRDGRALRFDGTKKVLTPQQAFATRLRMIQEDIGRTAKRVIPSARPEVRIGDARNAAVVAKDHAGAFDRIVFSPPYPNNIDYTEVYKMENWVLGEWLLPKDMREQRLKTLRSHPSVLFPDEYSYLQSPEVTEFSGLVDPLVDSVPEDRYTRGRQQLIRGYVDDMRAVLIACRQLIAPTGRLYCVVGNSVHGDTSNGFVVAADVLIARAGELTGWRVVEVRVARTLTRRTSQSPYVRESIVILEPA